MSNLRTFAGPVGSVHELSTDIPPSKGMPEQSATLAHWFCLLPPAHPLWPHYLLFTCHLRDVPGQSRPPSKPFKEATHNLMLLALNPELGPWTAENVVEKMLAPRTMSAFLEPLNISEFFVATDDQARELTMLIARSLADGYLPAECDDYIGSRDLWRRTIANTLEHFVHGGHAVDRRN